MDVSDPIFVLKRQLGNEIRRLVQPYTQDVAAGILGIDQPRVSDVMHDKIRRFSLQRLIRMLARMDRTIEIRVTGSASPASTYFKKRFAAQRARRVKIVGESQSRGRGGRPTRSTIDRG